MNMSPLSVLPSQFFLFSAEAAPAKVPAGTGPALGDCRLASDFSGHMLQPSVLPTTKLLLKNVAGFALQPCLFYCPALSPLRQPVVPVSEMAKCQRFGDRSGVTLCQTA